MAKGVNIPLTISGLREARENLEKLNEEFEKVKNDPIESKKIAKEFNELSKAVDGATEELIKMNNAGQLVGTKFDDLNEVLFQTQEEVLPLTSQIGEMEDRLYQLAKAGDTSSAEFKALQAEIVKNRKTIIETDRAIDSMVDNAGSLGGITTAFTELGDSLLSLDFKRANTALKGLGTQFKAFGATLLANPIFLIVAVIAAVVTAVITLKDNVKFLGDVFEFFAEPIRKAIQGLKDFLDMIGATNFAMQRELDMLNQVIEKQKEKAALVSSAFDRAIALAQAEGKTTEDMEIRKQKAIIETANKQLEYLKSVIKVKSLLNQLDEEETKNLQAAIKEQVIARTDAENQIKIIEANSAKERVANTETEAKEKKEAYKEYLQFRLEAARMIEDLELELLEESEEKRLLQNRIAFERLREEALANEKLTREERLEINRLYDELELQSEVEILDSRRQATLQANQLEAKDFSDLQVLKTELYKKESENRVKLTREEREAIADISVKGIQLVAGIAELFADKNEKAARVAFNVQKVASIAQATMDGYKAVLSTYAGTPGGPAIKAIAAGIAGSFAALQIANIAKTKFDGGNGSVSSAAPSDSFGGGGATSASASTPSFELFGNANDFNNVESAQSQDVTPTMTVKAVVVESDITNTQNKVAKMQKNAEL